MFRVLPLLLALSWLVAGCAASERAAAKDPRTCEQNPDCASKRGSYIDCTRQCADDPECVRRCQEMAPDQPKH